jgi:hypothetical protein
MAAVSAASVESKVDISDRDIHNFPVKWAKMVTEGQRLLETVKPGLSKEWTFVVGIGKHLAGAANSGKKTIKISKNLVGRDDDNLTNTMDTLRHEIAHAAVSTWNRELAKVLSTLTGKTAPEIDSHGIEWKEWAVKLGAKPERCHKMTFAKPKYIKCCEKLCWVKSADRRSKKTWVCITCKSPIVFHLYTDELFASMQAQSSKKKYDPAPNQDLTLTPYIPKPLKVTKSSKAAKIAKATATAPKKRKVA